MEDQNYPKVKKFFFLFIFILSFSKASSENYKIIKVTDLNNPWGSSFLNNNEIIITEKSGLIKIVNIINNQVINVEHNLNFLEDGQGGLLDILHKDNKIWISYTENRGNSKTSTSIALANLNKKKIRI